MNAYEKMFRSHSNYLIDTEKEDEKNNQDMKEYIKNTIMSKIDQKLENFNRKLEDSMKNKREIMSTAIYKTQNTSDDNISDDDKGYFDLQILKYKTGYRVKINFWKILFFLILFSITFGFLMSLFAVLLLKISKIK